MNYYSPLRYPGGKGKFSKFIQDLILDNNLLDCEYIEPFCGGSAVALALLFEGYARKIVINDYDPVVFAFWDAVINNTDELLKLITDTKLSIEEWNHAKHIHSDRKAHSNLEVGFATFLLNRVNRSGILKAGIIGGKGQLGVWKMDARYNIVDLKQRIEKIALKGNRIEIMNLDVLECIETLKERNPVKPLIYFDPPYYHKGPELYLNYFQHGDHVRISEYIKELKFSPWIVSYDNCVEINNLYSFAESKSYELNYSAGSIRSKGKELLFGSQGLKLPITGNQDLELVC
ncbi:DNA adenine methylase [Mucilaginibacter sp. AW1-3]